MADSAFPGFTGEETQEEKIERILDYLYQMNEQYRYILCQLNIEGTELEDGD
jgi:hypothetical protein